MANRMVFHKLHRLTLTTKGKAIAKHPALRSGVVEVVKANVFGDENIQTMTYANGEHVSVNLDRVNEAIQTLRATLQKTSKVKTTKATETSRLLKQLQGHAS